MIPPVDHATQERWVTDGKFFRADGRRLQPRMTTYGPFPPGCPENVAADFRAIAAAGFHAVRLYEWPTREWLDAALAAGLRVFAGMPWDHYHDFLADHSLLNEARGTLLDGLAAAADHPALAGVYVANEIPPALVREMGAHRVRLALEYLIDLGRRTAPSLLWSYANFPLTEFLEPQNADFTSFNIFLEDPDRFRSYLRRLHHIAGDRPLVVSEFGLDVLRHGPERQAETLGWALRIALEEDVAGFTAFTWSARWWNGGREVTDWDFGLIDREGRPRPVVTALADCHPEPAPAQPFFSVIVCTRNGAGRIVACLDALARQRGAEFETIVVDDGSTDGTAERVGKRFPDVRLLRLPPSGLSAARNAGAAIAKGNVLSFTDDDCEPDEEWLARLARGFRERGFAAVGGPNLAPVPRTMIEAIVAAAPGAPSHVMINDRNAEHIPGCNLSVTRTAFDAIGGFDARFHTAGDDVDFCWRLQESGLKLGFVPGAFVWHHRRPSLRGYLRQQAGYGKAERMLLAKHPQRFTPGGDAIWHGFVYGGAPLTVRKDSTIHHSPEGSDLYGFIVDPLPPRHPLHPRFACLPARCLLAVVAFMAPRLRAWHRRSAGGAVT